VVRLRLDVGAAGRPLRARWCARWGNAFVYGSQWPLRLVQQSRALPTGWSGAAADRVFCATARSPAAGRALETRFALGRVMTVMGPGAWRAGGQKNQCMKWIPTSCRYCTCVQIRGPTYYAIVLPGLRPFLLRDILVMCVHRGRTVRRRRSRTPHHSTCTVESMTTKKKWTVIPGFLALAAAATLLSAYSGASSSQGKVVEQPVKFIPCPHVQSWDELPVLP
jgi:hypothetical protein